MKKSLGLLIATMITTAVCSMTAFAAGWTTGQGMNSNRWWYDLGNGNH